jgi:DNA-binding transcriptional MerR regulator
MTFISEKLYYKIGEVCRIVGVEPYVLRYWETEFSALAPPKNKGGQRTYRPKDIELLLEIRRLLYEEGFTIAGARKRLASRSGVERAHSSSGASAKVKRNPPAVKKAPASQRIDEVRRELENILTLLERE